MLSEEEETCVFTRSPRSPTPPPATNLCRPKASKRRRKETAEDPLASAFTSFIEDSKKVNNSISSLCQPKDEHDLFF